MQYVTLPHMRVQGANMYNTGFLVGGPPVLAAYFMAHALGRKLYMADTVRSVALIFHEYVPLGDTFYGVLQPHQRRAAAFTFGNFKKQDYSSKNPHALSLQPVACAHMRLSLIIGTKQNMPLDDLYGHVLGGRFSGGSILHVRMPRYFDDIEDALQSIGTGFVVMDRRDLLEGKSASERAGAFVNALGHVSAKDAGGDDGLSWLSATCLGYAGISPYAKRRGVREGYEHAFVEPLAGLVQYVSLRQCLEDERAAETLWRPEWLADDVFRMYQKSYN